MTIDHTTPDSLTPRELDILRGMVEGLSNVEIAEQLILSTGTVKWYVKQLYNKLGTHSREEAISQALSLGLVATPLTGEELENDGICPLINPLPQDVSGRYVGNSERLALLTGLLQQPVRLISIYGRAGSGKTALACKAISDVRQAEKKPMQLSGIVSLSAITTGITFNRLMVDLGRLLSEKEQSLIEGMIRNAELPLSQKIGILLEKIAAKHIILLLDNLETIQQPTTGELIDASIQQFIETALTQSSALTLVVTSREPLVLPRSLKIWEQLISLENGLPTEDAVDLLRKFDPSGVTGLRDASSEELREVAERLGGFPRALEAVAGMLLENPVLRLSDITREFNSLQGEISAAVVEQALVHLNDEAMRLLQSLAIFDQPVSYEMLAYLLAPYLPDSTLQAVLRRLIQACFVKADRVTQQFALHPLDKAYCYAQIPDGNWYHAETEPVAFTRAVLHQRAAQFYEGQCLPRSEWRRIADLEAPINAFKQWVNAGAGDEAAKVLLDIDRDHLWEWGYKDLLEQFYAMLEKVTIHDPHVAHHVARRKAWLKFFKTPEESDQEFVRLLESARRLGFVKEEADALDDLAQTFRRGNRNLEQGVLHHRQALALYRQIGDRRGEADALGGLGAIFTQIEPEEAIDCLLKAGDIQRELGNDSSLSFVLTMLGSAYDSLGALEQAMTTLEMAAQIAQECGSLEALSRAYGGLARFCVSIGDIERGRAYIEEARTVTHALAGVPINASLIFFVGITAVYMALVGDAPSGIELLEEVIEDAAVFPRAVLFGNSWLSLVVMLDGDFQRAHKLLLSVSQMTLTRSPSNTFWIGVLLIKVGESDAAAAFFNAILVIGKQSESEAAGLHHLQARTRPMFALAHAGLALLKNDPTLALQAAELTRQALRIKCFEMDIYRAMVKILIQEPGGAILLPIRDMLTSSV